MELDQEKLTRNESERSRELAQRIRRELGPCSVQVLGGVGALESALEAVGAVQPAEGALPELLVVVDPEWVTLPQQLADRVHVLFPHHYFPGKGAVQPLAAAGLSHRGALRRDGGGPVLPERK